MPHPKFQIHKERPGRYRVNIPKSLSTDRPRRRRRRFFSTLEEAEAFVRSYKSQLRDLGTSFRILKPLDSADADEAIKLSDVMPSNMASDAHGYETSPTNGSTVGMSKTVVFRWASCSTSIWKPAN